MLILLLQYSQTISSSMSTGEMTKQTSASQVLMDPQGNGTLMWADNRPVESTCPTRVNWYCSIVVATGCCDWSCEAAWWAESAGHSIVNEVLFCTAASNQDDESQCGADFNPYSSVSLSDLHSIESREGNLPFQRHSCLVHLKPLQPSEEDSY